MRFLFFTIFFLAAQLSISAQALKQEPAIDFKLPDQKGDSIALSQFRGQVIFLDFWASWCAPCRVANKHLVKIFPAMKNKGVVFISVSLDAKPVDWINAIKKDKLSWVQLIDKKGWNSPLVTEWGINSIPASFLIDQEGNIIAKNLVGEALENAINALANK